MKTVYRYQHYQMERDSQHQAILEDVQTRVKWGGFIKILVLIVAGFLQFWILRRYIDNPPKSYSPIRSTYIWLLYCSYKLWIDIGIMYCLKTDKIRLMKVIFSHLLFLNKISSIYIVAFIGFDSLDSMSLVIYLNLFKYLLIGLPHLFSSNYGLYPSG